MRTLPAMALVLTLTWNSSGLTRAGEGCADMVACSACFGESCGENCADRCGCGLFGRLRGCHGAAIEGLDRHFNCGCRGSYNYPVPPQYTYHWPGMYKQSRMTDYVSPWRFPPLRPYVDELPVHSAEALPPTLRPVSTVTIVPIANRQSGSVESVSSRLMRYK